MPHVSLLSAHYIVNFIIIVVVMVIFLGMSLDVYGIIKMYMLEFKCLYFLFL